MNFKDRLFHSSPLLHSNNILKFGDKITLENIFFDSVSINMEVPSILNDWLIFSEKLHRDETCRLASKHLNIPTF